MSFPNDAILSWHVDWSPTSSGTSHHFCIRAVVTVPGDPNSDNKRVLSNFGNVQVAFARFKDFTILRRHLDLRLPRKIDLIAVPRFPPEFELAIRDLQEQRTKVLKPGETSVDQLRIYHRPFNRKLTGTEEPKHDEGKEEPCPCSAPLKQELREPDLSGFYPVDPRTLPPGLKDVPMVTLVHRSEGQVIGGVTLMLSIEEKGK